MGEPSKFLSSSGRIYSANDKADLFVRAREVAESRPPHNAFAVECA